MAISFNLPIGETVTIVSPVLFPQRQGTPILLTARLNSLNYIQLIADGGRIELWSNIGSGNSSNRAWNERPFVDSRKSEEAHSSAYMLPLHNPPHVNDPQAHTFYLPITLPPLEASESLRFSFTYRIVYPSGRTTWLGNFGQNGVLILKAHAERLFNSVKLSGEWSLDSSQQAYFQEFKRNVDAVEVATIENSSEFHIWAMGREKLIDNWQNASVLFLVPKTSTKSPALHPTYVFAASPNMRLSASTDKLVTTISSSGSGILLLQVKDQLQDPAQFIQQIISHSKLDKWNVLATDMKKQAVVLAPTAPTFPMLCTIISLWPSNHLPQFIELDASVLNKTLMEHEIEEFAVLPSSKEFMHILPIQGPERRQPGTLRLDFDMPVSHFTVAPIYRLKQPNDHGTRKDWGIAILTNYKKVSPPHPSWDVLPTPPASPPASRTLPISGQSSTNLPHSQPQRLALGLYSSVPDDTITGEESGDRVQELEEPTEDPRHERPNDPSGDRNQRHLPSLPIANKNPADARPGFSTLLILHCLFSYFTAVFKILSIVFRARATSAMKASPSAGNEQNKHPKFQDIRSVADVHEMPKSVDNDPGSDHLPRIAAEETATDKWQITSSRTPTACVTTFENSLSAESHSGVSNISADTASSSVRSDSCVPEPEDHTFCAELYPFELNGDDKLVPATTLVDIVLLPLPNPNVPQIHTVGPLSDDSLSCLNNAMTAAVAFIDRCGPLPCVITQLQTVWCALNEAHVPEDGFTEAGHLINFTSYLLQYQLDSKDRNKGERVSVDVPEAQQTGDESKAR